jgi:FMN phosphatase YigB (HAD superfamily)
MIKVIVSDLSNTILFAKDSSTQNSGTQTESGTKHGLFFWSHYDLNHEYLDILKLYKDRCRLYLFTSGELHRTFELKSALSSIFVHMFNTEDIGFPKSSSKSYSKLAKIIGVEPFEVLLIDDNKTFINAAVLAGFQTLIFDNNQNVGQELQKLIQHSTPLPKQTLTGRETIKDIATTSLVTGEDF